MNKVNTQAERDEVAKKAQVNLLRRIKLNEAQRQSVDSRFQDDVLYDNKPKSNVFGSYVDQLVIKNFTIETLQTRLKLSKETVVSFVSKLNPDELYILSQHLQDFIKYILETNNNSGVNDFILKTNFTTYKLNVEKQGKKLEDTQIVVAAKQNEEDTLQEAGITQKGAEDITLQTSKMDLYDDMSDITESISNDYNGGKEIKYGNLFDILQSIDRKQPKNKLVFYNQMNSELKDKYTFLKRPPTYVNSQKKTSVKGNDAITQIYEEFTSHTREMNKQKRDKMTEDFLTDYAIKAGVVNPKQKKNKPPIPSQNITDIMKMKGKGFSREYMKLGKYFIQPNRLNIDKVLQVRSGTGTQVNGVKPVRLSNSSKKVIDKVLYQKPITYEDINNLDEKERDQLYTIANKMKITELMNIPSKIKNREEKLRDEFLLLRGEIVNGNDNIDMIKRFKVVLLKLREAKLISVYEFNETLKLLFEYGV